MFKSFLTSDRKLPAGVSQSPDEPTPPPATQRAVRLMIAGAATSTVYLIFSVIMTTSLKSALTSANNAAEPSKRLTDSQLNSLTTYLIVTTIVIGLAAIGLWLWMAKMNSLGKNWARITSSVLFLLWTYYTYTSIGDTHGAASLVVSLVIVLVIWAIGLAALFMLWRQDSTAFFKDQSTR
jgi:multisubunit Na+/H+ antiporter MnhC subunit